MYRIRSDCNGHSHPREHWTRKKGNWKPKKDFGTIQIAESFIQIHKYKNYKAYECSICGGIHIGYNKERAD